MVNLISHSLFPLQVTEVTVTVDLQKLRLKSLFYGLAFMVSYLQWCYSYQCDSEEFWRTSFKKRLFLWRWFLVEVSLIEVLRFRIMPCPFTFKLFYLIFSLVNVFTFRFCYFEICRPTKDGFCSTVNVHWLKAFADFKSQLASESFCQMPVFY